MPPPPESFPWLPVHSNDDFLPFPSLFLFSGPWKQRGRGRDRQQSSSNSISVFPDKRRGLERLLLDQDTKKVVICKGHRGTYVWKSLTYESKTLLILMERKGLKTTLRLLCTCISEFPHSYSTVLYLWHTLEQIGTGQESKGHSNSKTNGWCEASETTQQVGSWNIGT